MTDGTSNGLAYNGSAISPNIEILLLLRRGSVPSRDPNVVSGNNLAWRMTSAQYTLCTGVAGPCFEALEPYLDECVGTIRPMANLPSPTPQGWAVMDGVSNSAGNGGSGINAMTVTGNPCGPFLAAGTPGTVGGMANGLHAHSLSGVAGTAKAGSDYTLPTTAGAGGVLPPYAEIGGWIERLNNGQT
jgi:hypothetical protein